MSSSDRRRPKTTSMMEALVSGAAATPFVVGYRIDRLIGEGGFGQVWHATRDDGSSVAIKILHAELVRSKDALTRFERELSAIERLHHRNVVAAFDHGTLDDGRPYLVLEYIEGPSLRDTIHERRTLPPHEMLAILEPLCEALDAAHAEGLVHRDVKASNVILGRDALGARPVLLDFGLVKLLGDTTTLTSSRSMLGTPAAMSPEQMKGGSVDARTDVYALGLLAYHMLTGSPAYGGTPGIVQTYLQHHGPRPRPSAHVDIDPAIDGPIERALQPDPDARFPTARALYDALRGVIDPMPAGEQEVVTLYIEAGPAELAIVANLATTFGMTIALTAPDSLLAVAPHPIDTQALVAKCRELGGGACVALGLSRASICGSVVDGPALDVEAWAPYPLARGLWISPNVR